MKPVVYILTVLAIMGLAVWAYQQNYATQAELKRVDQLHHDIAVSRERLTVLRAEWAYLNRPDRLRDLAAMNFDQLRLLPLSHSSFGHVEQIAFPDQTVAGLPVRPGAEVSQ